MNKLKFCDKVHCIHGVGLVSRVWFDYDVDTWLCEVVFILNNQTCTFTVPVNDLTLATDWIPCSERMPELNVPVLVHTGSRMEIDHTYDFGDGASFYNDLYDDVTHWMPLPAPPTEVER